MRHMPLPEWDKKVAPLLGAMKNRATWLRVDANQINQWVKELAAVPEFEIEAMAVLIEARECLADALRAVEEAIHRYNEKEKVT